MALILLPHPATPPKLDVALSAALSPRPAGLAVRFVLKGALDLILWPSAAPVRHTDDLWRKTCFELFVETAPPAYREYNFAPSGAFAAYAFEAERLGRRPAPDQVSTAFQRLGDEAILEAEITSEAAAAFGRIGLTAVLQDISGALSYWALNHPKDRPDFHDPQGFATSSVNGAIR
jgi:hypothetical protein